MTIAYNWLNEYLPEKLEPQRLSKILTSIGLEVEGMKKYENIKGGLQGLVMGEILTCEKHPDADKLKITTVNIGKGEPLKIVCGAPNVAAAQKVIVAPAGTTIYPLAKEPVQIKKTAIRGQESNGMICAEDEIGISADHAGIILLPATAIPGEAASKHFKYYEDVLFEIGLTPNRMDAMSHLGVAKDVSAYLSHHERKHFVPKKPYPSAFKIDSNSLPITVEIENKEACRRYSGISIKNVNIKQSPDWLQQRLKAIGVKPINNVVDISNYVLHETGQPLHAFDADKIAGAKVIVKTLPEGSMFKTLDDKDRTLTAEDVMICDTEGGMCIAGVFGGINSGVKETTKNIFLESAWFNPVSIRRTSVHHGLRTDAASHFEKGVDISNTVNVLKRAALLIKEIAGGEIAGEIVDMYPGRMEKTQVRLKYHYLKKLSGKNYHPDSITGILKSLDFEILKEGMDELIVSVPYSNPDITLPADIVEEIIRIDGLDNIDTPSNISITPANNTLATKENLREKISDFLAGNGFNEILTNSITDSAYYSEEELGKSVKLINTLSANLNIMRPSMLETTLESIAYNLKRKNANLRFFEFGKIYSSEVTGSYKEKEQICIAITGQETEEGWREKSRSNDFFTLKGIAGFVLQVCGIHDVIIDPPEKTSKGIKYNLRHRNHSLGSLLQINERTLQSAGIKQPVVYLELDFGLLVNLLEKTHIMYREIARFPPVQRDLAFIIDKATPFAEVEAALKKLNINRLQQIRLFDVFESDKIAEGKKSLALSFTFLDEEKTLTDSEVDTMINRLIETLQTNFKAELRN